MMKIHQAHLPRSLSTDSCNKAKALATTDQILIKHSISYDEVDNPVFREFFSSEEELFRAMKYECNRLYSFKKKWPLKGMKPEDFAAAGFFYLQEGDRVQCPFCTMALGDWTPLDEPLREHMKTSPRCPFLMGARDCGNVPLSKQEKRMHKELNCGGQFSAQHVDYKPKVPAMSDAKLRLLTFSCWRNPHPQPKDLADCGFFYNGVGDVVTCFFCGGSLSKWEPTDNPWEEHSKFYRGCAFLSLAGIRNTRLPPKVNGACKTPFWKAANERGTDITTDIVQEAIHIFPEPMVRDAIERNGGNVTSLEKLCNDIVVSQGEKNKSPPESSSNETLSSSYQENGPSTSSSDTLLCKICMDREREVLFMPCKHFTCCYKCSQRLRDCPTCKNPIEHVERIYY